jgi:hypothetical protein
MASFGWVGSKLTVPYSNERRIEVIEKTYVHKDEFEKHLEETRMDSIELKWLLREIKRDQTSLKGDINEIKQMINKLN